MHVLCLQPKAALPASENIKIWLKTTEENFDSIALESCSNIADDSLYNSDCEISVGRSKSEFNEEVYFDAETVKMLIQGRGKATRSTFVSTYEGKELLEHSDEVYEDAHTDLMSDDSKPLVDSSSEGELLLDKSNQHKGVAHLLSLRKEATEDTRLKTHSYNKTVSAIKKECLKLKPAESNRNPVKQVFCIDEKQSNTHCLNSDSTNEKLCVGCECDNCSMWQTNDLSGRVLVFADEKQKEPKIAIKPPLLLKKDNENGSVVIKSQSIHSLTKAQQVLTPTLLVHG